MIRPRRGNFHSDPECKVIHIGRKNIERTYNLASVGEILDLAGVDEECDLGVDFSPICSSIST